MKALPNERLPMIVVIDNERNVQATLSAVLQRNGFAVEIAPNAAQGWRKVTEVNPDLVLLDLGRRMPTGSTSAP